MTVRAGLVLDRRRVALLDEGLPCLPHHHEAQGLPLADATLLIERVRASAERHARDCLDALAREHAPHAIALRACPPLPETIAERLASYRAQNVADTAMYRTALAGAAAQRGWRVTWYEPKRVDAEAARALGLASLEPFLERAGAALGRPWTKDHRMAMAAAIAATA